ncbi:MAG TPA: multifunctional oxoglutarate decarboxylase/oxoglutarate dehydrogenase thiamine pyrophosphate-binding subunit/dihydrolipoyllysine-residue succinyltransferase subunit [Acidimicrobiales bacterium]|nr:multifunctional oxoglutarate decarboxylase/oxoglutarate dehydrogenase thiamine pyrophosphate-binding subunit/dihydrolipoyllysine-residue succinyltransferase subunit [Acidimicrobiales bacterium]
MADHQRVVSGPPTGGAFGPNAWLVDDMYEQFRSDPSSVSESWREFFADYTAPGTPATESSLERSPSGNGVPAPESGPAKGARSNGGSSAGNRAPAPATATPVPAAEGGGNSSSAPVAAVAAVLTAPGEPTATEAPTPIALRGAAARIAVNMEASLAVPTATSVRTVPAKLLEVNRSMLNQHLVRTSGTKVSFTHLIGYAVVQALQAVPALNSSYVDQIDEKGTAGVLHHRHVGLGLAVDLTKPDGSRTLLVPVVSNADSLDFRAFVVAYEDMVRRVHTQKVTVDDFIGATVTLTNPGTLGTGQSVPRLMPGQGAIIGVGALGFPAEYQAADRRSLAALGVGPVVTLTSTYDHRIIQGAESGMFLTHMAQCLTGEHSFYETVFAAMDVPYEPVRWQADVNAVDSEHQRLVKQVRVQSLVNMYRVRGHLIADLDPLSAEPRHLHAELDPTTYGLTLWDLDREFVVDGLAGRDTLRLAEALDLLRDAYCRTLAVEYMHIQDPEQKRWIQHHVEGVPATLSPTEQRHILNRLNAAEAFERFLHTRYVGQKRFGLEGAESTIVLLDALLDEAASAGMSEAVLGMAHRGRLNVLANIVGKSYGEIFREFEGDLDPDSVQGSGDVKYHKGASGTFTGHSGGVLPVTLASNPSHLEAVDPVVEGMVRAKQDQLPLDRPFGVLSLLIHGDAAFAGQGVVAETLELSQLAGYRTGGTVHVVVNNQLGFTTAPESARSSVYPTDVAKMVQAPVFHVNGDDPEACARAARLAFGFRQAFHKDVVIDVVCYRRFGHNEGDDPSYTQPRMYAIIETMRSVRKLYTEALVRRGDITMEEAEQALSDFQARLQTALDETRQTAPPQPTTLPAAVAPVAAMAEVETGVDRQTLMRLVSDATVVPDGFTIHPKLLRQFQQRAGIVADGEVDWALGEALAMGSLLLEGTNVRLAGQDTRRGTFSQRHAVLVDYATGNEWVPLAHLEGEGVGRLAILDSLLSEYAAVGFEYGYSVEMPDALVAWEAQFGDFANGAQIVIDNFLVAADDKWEQGSGLVLLLPHGYEGQGPEHSSARIERFLTLCARGNIRLAQPTTAAQYFHLLRSQARGAGNKPLIVFTPKSLLRARQSRSPIDELATGSFRPVLDDPAASGQTPGTAPVGQGQADNAAVDPSGVRRVLLCSGKVAFDAIARRDQLVADPSGLPSPAVEARAVAVIRVEQLYPWPEGELAGILDRYPSATEVVWLQEEPENMGAWSFAHGRLHKLLRDRFTLVHVSRSESASPATGSAALHHLEHEDLLARAFG